MPDLQRPRAAPVREARTTGDPTASSGPLAHLPWLALPWLFLPESLLGGATGFGTLTTSDLLLGPFVAVALLSATARSADRIWADPEGARAGRLLAWFVGWTLVSTVTIGWRYGYRGDYETTFGLLKLAKLSLYLAAGGLTLSLIRTPLDAGRFLTALLAGGVISSLAFPLEVAGLFSVETTQNAASVQTAVLLGFLTAVWAAGGGTPAWRRLAPVALGLIALGLLFSRGRGGWLCALAGLGWLLYRQQRRARAFVITGALVIVALGTFLQVPEFRAEVVRTLGPTFGGQATDTVLGLDEAGRLRFWTQEGPKLVAAPILGRGLFNRFPGSDLDRVGSHSFWIQMFLETGVVGGGLVLALVWQLGQAARGRQRLPAETALVVAVLGGATGEYFYGGTPLLVFVLCAGTAVLRMGLGTHGRSKSRTATRRRPVVAWSRPPTRAVVGDIPT